MASSTSEAAAHFRRLGGDTLMYVVFDLVVQTFFFGVYTLLIYLSTRMLLKRGLKARSNRVMLTLTLFMYLLSTGYLAYSVAYVVRRMQVYVNNAPFETIQIPAHGEITTWSPVFNSIILVNYVLSDGVVVWRAWVICNRRLRKYLWITTVFLVLTAIGVGLTIGFRIAAFVELPIPQGSFLKPAIDASQISTLVLSLVSNLSATAVVGVTAWRHRRVIRVAFAEEKTTTKTDQILGLIAESGIFYSISGILLPVATLVRLPHGTLGTLYTPIHVQIASAYPSIVIVLVSMQRSLNETVFDAQPSEFTSTQPVGSADTSPTTTVGGPEIVKLSENPPEKIRVQRSHFSDDSWV
ncbi:hypothetical protein C8R43DRAFT_1046821 [Mycena crocata]|nr:hypothetical protein C8R43DRAFT_1046821 [Mycena crocata]